MNRYSNENPFFIFMGNVGDYIILNLLFVLTSIPIVTVGMSLDALYRVILRRTRGESIYPVREYFSAIKDDWKQATKLWLIFLITGAILIFDVLYVELMSTAMNIAIGCLVALWLIVFSYAFPLQARFDNTIKNTLINALALAISNLPSTIIIAVINFIPFFLVILGPNIAALALPIYVVIGFSLSARINCIFFNRIMDRFMKITQDEDDPVSEGNENEKDGSAG